METIASDEPGYRRDAYVTALPENFPMTHAVAVDLIQEGRVVHQIVNLCIGPNSARLQSDQLNLWRDQSTLAMRVK